jgi:hypothetical protein
MDSGLTPLTSIDLLFKLLRESLQQPSGEKPNKPVRQKPSEAEITKLLNDSDASRRAEGLAAAGYLRFLRLTWRR